jgi:hypothetical protein
MRNGHENSWTNHEFENVDRNISNCLLASNSECDFDAAI